jgi:cytochrome c-type biogenesis protein CcmH
VSTRGRLSGGLVLAAVVVALGVLVLAWTRTGAAPTDQQQAQRIAAGLRCPVCKDLSAADSPAPLARQMRTQIQRQVAAGTSAAEIRQGFVDAYGPSVLMSPPAHGWGRVAHLLPFVVVGGCVLGGGVLLRRALRPDEPTDPPESLSAEDRALVDRALADLLKEER